AARAARGALPSHPRARPRSRWLRRSLSRAHDTPGGAAPGNPRACTMPAMADHLFLRACRRQPVARTPIWMMRQAGRYFPAYRAVRERASFRERCRTPALACEVTLQPIDEFGFDAAILFSDILITLPAMGIDVAFPDAGPKIDKPVRTRAAIDALAVPDPV